MAGDPLWTDGLDDSSHVYITDRVEVTGGVAQLMAGEPKGFIASSVITCPAGFRYDVVYLEAEVPGASQVLVSVLNASKESSEVGFANETIPPHIRINGTDHSVYDVSPWMYPAIRIQVNLVASGADRPRLLAWSLYYVALDEWRDDFLGAGKMSSRRGLNLTDGRLEVDLTARKGKGVLDYEAYPPIALPSQTVRLLYPNSAHTDYSDFTTLSGIDCYGTAFGDLNGDGILDLVVAEHGSGNSRINWGSGSGTYSDSDKSELTTTKAYYPVVGDFNGDGWSDVAIGWYVDSAQKGIKVFLNNGDGMFDSAADIAIDDQTGYVYSGDFNGDGYDDIASYQCVYYGGPDGPSTSPAVTFGTGMYKTIKDVNLDGIDDIIGYYYSPSLSIYLGSTTGIDAIADHTIDTSPLYSGIYYSVDAGDINGDGYIDVVVSGYENVDPYPYHVYVYEGKADGWVSPSHHTVMSNIGYGPVVVGDIDKDGFDDIVTDTTVDGTTYSLRVFFGSSSWPSTPAGYTKASAAAGMLSIAIPKGGGGPKYHVGTFTTTTIDLPPGEKWDILHADGAFPQNTSMELSVLDPSGREIAGYRKLTETDVDLSSITLERSIRVKVTLMSEFNWTTPSLDRLIVKWMDRGAWREQFYGAAKVERTLNLVVAGGELTRSVTTGAGPQLLFTGLRGWSGYDVRPQAYVDGGGLDYASTKPIPFEAMGVSAADAADVNGDGFMDVAFAVRQTGDTTFGAKSMLFLGSAVGWRATYDHAFPTTGASDLLLRDINGDGWVDVIFAQETDGTTYRVNSTLFWGKPGGGWNATPDLQFETNGASGAAAADLDGDGRLDLAFACYKDASSTSTDSMVFLQGAAGFCGTVPSYRLPTKGARAVSAGDVNGDGRADLAFANSLSGGSAEIDSYVYLGRAGGGFETAPRALRTAGARDVELADLDGDGDLDVVFANMKNNVPSYRVDSYVYMNDGSGGFPATPSARLPTTGAVAVAVTDLDGTGRKDLAFACQYDGTSYNTSSVVFLGGASGWATTPQMVLPTVGASDVLVGHLIKAGQGGYVSKPITPEEPLNTGAFHTFRYTASLGAGQSGRLQLIDASTWEVLAGTALQAGTSEWPVKDLFWVKEHPSVRVVMVVSGLDGPGECTVGDLWLNWTARVKRPPVISDLGLSSSALPRMSGGTLWLNVTDEYDPVGALRVSIDHRLNGSADPWLNFLLGAPYFSNGTWRAPVSPKGTAPVGSYDLRVQATDSDGNRTGYVVFPNALRVRNNVPSAPVVRIGPPNPVTTSTLQAGIVRAAVDLEGSPLAYRYRWFKDGALQADLTTDTVLSLYTTRGENWSVEVRAFDGLDESAPGTAWTVIGNAAPFVKRSLPNPELKEDTADDQWLDLGGAFEDPDGDALTWTLGTTPQHIAVTVDPATGRVVLVPEANWNGEESVTFIALDGLAQASQTVLVTVTAVDDPPVFTSVNGQPITTDPIAFTIDQGELLVIRLGTSDIEGDELSFSVNTTAVQVDVSTGEIRFQPGNEVVGTLRFAVTMTEVRNPTMKVKLSFAITVVNVNDPPSDPQITSPKQGARHRVDANFTLIGICTDPDVAFGQVLNFSWYANGTLLGYGPSLTVSFKGAGNYTLMLSVTDGEFVKTASMVVEIQPKESSIPPPPPDGGGEHAAPPYALIVGAVVAACVVLIVVFLLVSRRRAERLEAKDVEDERREDFKRMAAEVKATADLMEREVAKTRAATPAETQEVVMETVGPDGKVTVSSEAALGQALTIQPRETEAASRETEQLFKDMSEAEPVMSAEEQERLRVDNLKRKYANAIGRLPYGIPSAELKGKDWNELAAALATGQRRTLPDGKEVTAIGGRWYFSDERDTSTFLKEHGARPRAEERKAAPVPAAAAAAAATPAVGKAALLEKLEERFILGEISEERYDELKRKLEGREGGPSRKGG